MALKRIENLIVKRLINQSSSSELDELEIWVNDSTNEKEFISYVKANYAIDYSLKKFNSIKTKNKIKQLIKDEKKTLRIRKILVYSKYAAVFTGMMISIYIIKNVLFLSQYKDEVTPVIVHTIQPGTNKATLTLDNGSVIALEKGKSLLTQNAKSNGEEIVYSNNPENTENIAYHYLTIPRGGQFYITLSDGTEVWLNSESQLKYPVRFIEGEIRQVELVYGEAYFDVSPSTENMGAKFVVLNNIQEVEVLGTEFNIRAYKGETNIYTTLVEGEVAVAFNGGKENLNPNQQSKLNIADKHLSVSHVNVYDEVSWKDGVFSFEKKPLAEIMKVLSRWYDIQVVFENTDLKEITFTGVLGKNQKVKDILLTLKTLSTIKDYEINNKTIKLK